MIIYHLIFSISVSFLTSLLIALWNKYSNIRITQNTHRLITEYVAINTLRLDVRYTPELTFIHAIIAFITTYELLVALTFRPYQYAAYKRASRSSRLLGVLHSIANGLFTIPGWKLLFPLMICGYRNAANFRMFKESSFIGITGMPIVDAVLLHLSFLMGFAKHHWHKLDFDGFGLGW